MAVTVGSRHTPRRILASEEWVVACTAATAVPCTEAQCMVEWVMVDMEGWVGTVVWVDTEDMEEWVTLMTRITSVDEWNLERKVWTFVERSAKN